MMVHSLNICIISLTYLKRLSVEDILTIVKMTFSWKELVLQGLLKKVGERSLVKDILKMIMKERREHFDEEARKFQSRFVCPVVGVYRQKAGVLVDQALLRLGATPTMKENVRIYG